jgi:ABC-type polysaccharide/polyol phosphate transport system ATPase subunit
VAPAIELEGVWKRYRVYRERYRSLKEIAIHRRLGEWDDHWVLQDVSLSVQPGTSLGLIGPNGAGKSTTMKIMARILAADRGRVAINGRVSSLIELGAGFQPEYTGRENVFLNGSLLGMKGREIRSRLDQIVDFAELEGYLDQPLRTYSSGMAMRLGFAVAISVDPEVLLVDEVLAVGDESFQRKCFAWFQGFQRRGGTLVLVTHNLPAVTQMCDRAIWIANGRMAAEGEPTGVVRQYLNSVEELAAGGKISVSFAGRPAQLTSGQLLGADGKIAHTLTHGEGLVVRMGYRVNDAAVQPYFNVRIARDDGTEVYCVDSADANAPALGVGMEAAITLTFPSIPLMAGAYVVTVTMGEARRMDAPLLDEMQLRFNVVSTGRDSGLIRLRHTWSVEPKAAHPGHTGGTDRVVG